MEFGPIFDIFIDFVHIYAHAGWSGVPQTAHT